MRTLQGMQNRLKIIAALVIAALPLFMGGCKFVKSDSSKDDDKKRKDPPVTVEVTTIESGPISRVLKSSTTLVAEITIPVYARTVNQVLEILADESDEVVKDQVLLRMLDDIQMTQASRAETQMIRAQKEYLRVKALFDQNLVSEQEYQNAELEFKQQSLAYEDAKRELDYTVVRAPISGTITRRNARVGDFVGASRDQAALLFEIVDFRSMVAYIYLPEKHLAEVKLNQKAIVTVPALGDYRVDSFVMRIAPVVDQATGTFKVTIGFRDIGILRPGLYVNVDLTTAVNPDAVLIPKEALVYDADQIFAYRLISRLDYPERKVERVTVEPRLMDSLHVEPASGIAVGDSLVTAGKTGLKDGAIVRLTTDPKPETESKDDSKKGSKR